MERAIALLLLVAGLALGAACSGGSGDGGGAPAPAAPPTAVPATSTPPPTRQPEATRATAPKPAAGPTSPPLSPAVVSRVESILAKTAALRSLPLKGQVPVSALARDQLRPYLVGLFERERARADLEKDQAILVLLDLLREEDDLYRLWLNLLSEQVSGLYEFEGREMKLVGSAAQISAADEVTLAHESVHALQDQNFDLGSRLKKAKGVGESALALQALSEGDATLAMGLYARQNLAADQLAALANQAGGLSQDRLRAAPPVLQVNLLFPYLQGTAFTTALFQSGGWGAVDRAHTAPPATSEQILHPEKYLAGEGPLSVKMPDVAAALGSEWLPWKEDVLGELGVLVYLAGGGVPAEKATKAAAGWGGDRTLLFRSASGYKYALAVLTAWDTPADAAEFFSAVRDLRASGRGGTLTSPDDRRITWSAPSRGGYAALSGSQVALVIATDEATTKKIMVPLEAALSGRP